MITHFNRERLVRNLPDAYAKTEGSNNAKILNIEKQTMDELRNALNSIYDSLDIERASGKTLDMYGEMLGQARGIATDEQFRVLIKNRIMRNFADADHTSIVKALCMTFGCDASEILLTEPEVCKVRVEGLPFSKLNESNIDADTAVQIVKGLIPAGVFLEAVEFSGTFEFSDGTELVYDEAAGFADDAQTIGGYLGFAANGTANALPV